MNEPPIHELKHPESLNTSSRLWYDVVVVGGQPEDFLKTGLAFIDVRDVAKAHVLALEKEAAGGERIIISAGPFIWQQWGGYLFLRHHVLDIVDKPRTSS